MPEIHFFKLDIMLAMVMMMLMMQGRVVPTEDSLTAEWWETRARLSAGGLLGAGCQVGEDEEDDDQEDDDDDEDDDEDDDDEDDDDEDVCGVAGNKNGYQR